MSVKEGSFYCPKCRNNSLYASGNGFPNNPKKADLYGYKPWKKLWNFWKYKNGDNNRKLWSFGYEPNISVFNGPIYEIFSYETYSTYVENWNECISNCECLNCHYNSKKILSFVPNDYLDNNNQNNADQLNMNMNPMGINPMNQLNMNMNPMGINPMNQLNMNMNPMGINPMNQLNMNMNPMGINPMNQLNMNMNPMGMQ